MTFLDIEWFFSAFWQIILSGVGRIVFCVSTVQFWTKKKHRKVCFFLLLNWAEKFQPTVVNFWHRFSKVQGNLLKKNILSGKSVSLHDFWALSKNRSPRVFVFSASCQICILRVQQNLSKSFFQTKLLFSSFLDIEHKYCGCLSHSFR